MIGSVLVCVEATLHLLDSSQTMQSIPARKVDDNDDDDYINIKYFKIYLSEVHCQHIRLRGSKDNQTIDERTPPQRCH